MHMGGGGQAPAEAAASIAPGGGAHAISLSPLKLISFMLNRSDDIFGLVVSELTR